MQYTFCPFCATPYKEQTNNSYTCRACHRSIYLNSKPTASVLIIQDGKLLLGKRGIEPAKGAWDIIGGFLDLGEHPHDGAVREAKEETGLDVRVTNYLGSYMDIYGKEQEHTLNMAFAVEVIGGDPQPNDDIVELKWFSPEELPSNIAFENGKKIIQDWVNRQ